MAVDILKYTALNAKTQCLVAENANYIYGPLKSITCCGANQCYCLIGNYPLLSGGTSFNVCDTASTFRAGACCSWTVPAGVTAIQFQLWGGGGGSTSGICCSVSNFGASGSYAVIQIAAVPGCTYTLCSGAGGTYGYCNSTPGTAGSASYVTGYGLTSFCADGGLDSLNSASCQAACNGETACCRWTTSALPSGGSCICTDGSLNSSSACCSGMVEKVYLSPTYHGTTSIPLQGSFFNTAYGIPSMAGCGCTCGLCYYFMSPPVVSATHTFGCSWCFSFTLGQTCAVNMATSTTYCNYFYNSNCLCSCGCNTVVFGCWANACCGFLTHPGFGGFGSYYNSAGCWCGAFGDYGRAGMVRVTYC